MEKAYKHTLHLKSIYKNDCDVLTAKELFLQWINRTHEEKFEQFYTAANSILCHLDNIANFFWLRHTNANAESFNAKIKLFRAILRGVTDNTFPLPNY